jgi:hypothetical protein
LVARSNGTTVSLSAPQSLQNSVADATTTLSSLNRPAAGRDFDEQIEKMTSDLSRGDRTLSYALPFLGADGARTLVKVDGDLSVAGAIVARMRVAKRFGD